MDSSSLLDRPVTLAEILDEDSLTRVCQTFARLQQAHVAVVDSGGQLLVQTGDETAALRHLCGTQGCRPAVGREMQQSAVGNDAHASAGAGISRQLRCECGLVYQALNIQHQGAALGVLLLGPYRPDPADAGQLAPHVAGEDLQHLPPASQATSAEIAHAIGEVLGVIVQTGYARHLTSQIHIAAIQDAYNELQEKNRRLADSLDKLKELDKLKSNFLATVSHELRTPLTSVIGYSEMLLEGLAGNLSADQREYVQTIMDKGDQLLQIISEILDISKIESGNLQVCCERVDVCELVHQVSESVMPQARRKRITLQCRAADEVPAIVADRAKTRQVLLNLFSNAIKFTPEGGGVTASVAPGELPGEGAVPALDAVEIRVHDTGVGVSAAYRERIFEAFFQVDNSSTRLFGGTGLGLSIVKHFVEAHGGRVWVESSEANDAAPTPMHRSAQEGPGSTFVVLLPLSPPSGTPAARAAQQIIGQSGVGATG